MRASATLAAMQQALALKAAGADVVDLGAGEPDFDTPEHIKQAALEALRAGETKYTATGGTRELQQASTVEQPKAAVGVRHGLLAMLPMPKPFAGLLTKNPLVVVHVDAPIARERQLAGAQNIGAQSERPLRGP